MEEEADVLMLASILGLSECRWVAVRGLLCGCTRRDEDGFATGSIMLDLGSYWLVMALSPSKVRSAASGRADARWKVVVHRRWYLDMGFCNFLTPMAGFSQDGDVVALLDEMGFNPSRCLDFLLGGGRTGKGCEDGDALLVRLCWPD
ncbi:hypothetical protein ACLOJK_022642 [Asimina triloba]